MLNFTSFQVDQYKAFQNTMIENKIYFIDSPADVNPLLAADIGKFFFQIAFFIDWKFWQTGKLKDIWIFQKVLRFINHLPLF